MRRMEKVLWKLGTMDRDLGTANPGYRSYWGDYRFDKSKPIPRGMSITAPGIATALLDIIARDDLRRQFVFFAN